MKHLKTIILLNLFLFLLSCGTLKEGFTNQKKNNSDEFLVEKKKPLVMPPNYNELPEPGMKQKLDIKEKNPIKSLLINEDNALNDEKENDKEKKLEDSLLKKIKKN